jgi:hypothetical protein
MTRRAMDIGDSKALEIDFGDDVLARIACGCLSFMSSCYLGPSAR